VKEASLFANCQVVHENQYGNDRLAESASRETRRGKKKQKQKKEEEKNHRAKT